MGCMPRAAESPLGHGYEAMPILSTKPILTEDGAKIQAGEIAQLDSFCMIEIKTLPGEG